MDESPDVRVAGTSGVSQASYSLVTDDRRARRDAVLAVRTPWREGMAIVLTVLLAISVPLAAWAAAETGDRMAQVERAAITLEELGPQAEEIGATLADVTRDLTDLAAEYRPLITGVSDGVAEATARLDDLADDLTPVTASLGLIGALLSGSEATDGVGDAVTDAQLTVEAILGSLDDVAAVSADAADRIEVLTSPETLATIDAAAGAVEDLAALSGRAGELAGGYVDRADTISLVARVVAVLSVVLSVAWLVWRIGEHRRWQDLRRRAVGDAVLVAVRTSPT
jgi:hypothetical protein